MGIVRAFTRISVATEESGSLERQRADIERWQRTRDPTTHDPLVHDEGISGAKADRLKQRRKLLDEIESGDILAVAKVDRLARNVRDLLDIVQHCEDIDIGHIHRAGHLDRGPIRRPTQGRRGYWHRGG